MTMAPLRKVNFDANVFLLSKARDRELRSRPAEEKVEHVGDTQKQEDMRPPLPEEVPESKKESAPETVTLNLRASIPPESCNQVGTKLIPKLRSGANCWRK